MAAPGSDVRARIMLLMAWKAEGRPPPTLAAIQAVQTVARLETHYGLAWTGEGVGSRNWGAITCKRGTDGQCLGECFRHDDHDAEGRITHACFRRYHSDLEGARDLIRTVVTVRKPVEAVIHSGDVSAIARAMHATRYFVTTPEAYARAMLRHGQEMVKELREPLALRVGQSLAGGAILAGFVATVAYAMLEQEEPKAKAKKIR